MIAALFLAHHDLGHWLTSLAVYLVPVLLLAGWLGIVAYRSRRARREPESTALNSSGPPADN